MANVKYYLLNKKMMNSNYVFYLFYSNKNNLLKWIIINSIFENIKLFVNYVNPNYINLSDN
jgi:hypothetical protein